MAKSKQQEFKSLARYIIDKTDTNTYRAGNLVGCVNGVKGICRRTKQTVGAGALFGGEY